MNFLSALAWADLAIILAGALLGGFITGFAGFGAGLVASGFWFLALPAPMVPPMIVIASVAGQVVSLARVRHAFAWSRALPFLVPGLLAVPVGIYALTQSSPATLRFSVGAFLIAYALFNLFGLARWSIGNKGGRTADAAIGAAGGFLGGFAGLSGPVPLIWLQLRGGSRRGGRFISRSISSYWYSPALACSSAVRSMRRWRFSPRRVCRLLLPVPPSDRAFTHW